MIAVRNHAKERLEAGGNVLLTDTGKPPPVSVSREAHAGCLSFEFSAGLQRIVVNCGVPATSREAWRRTSGRSGGKTTG